MSDAPAWALLDDGETAVEADQRMRRLATPIDRRVVVDRWSRDDFANVTAEQMLFDFWGAPVPGSGAWDSMFVGMVASAGQLGFDVGPATRLLRLGLEARSRNDREACLRQAHTLLQVLRQAGNNPTHEYHRFDNSPAPAFQLASKQGKPERLRVPDIESRIHAGWVGQIAGGAFGTAIEGLHGDALAALYGRLDSYVGEVVTLNDDCVYELLALDMIEERGSAATSHDFADRWLREIPFAWSAEWVALENLRAGLQPPESGRHGNMMHDWIGAQMRTMVFGLLCPGDPGSAMSWARKESVISHAENGVLGGMFAAALVANAFLTDDPQELVRRSVDLMPPASEYGTVVRDALHTCEESSSAGEAWTAEEARHRHRNWIHAYPNIAAVIVALWFGGGDFTETMAIVGAAGLDADCNGGLVGTVLGVQNAGVPTAWSEPLVNRIDTYLPSAPTVAISELAERTFALSARADFGKSSRPPT